MKITNVSYQTNYSNNKSSNSLNSSVISKPIQFTALRAKIGEPIKKSAKLLKWVNKTGLAIQDKLGLLNVTTINYASPKHFPSIAPKNVHAFDRLDLAGAKIKGLYKAGENAAIDHATIALNGRLSVAKNLEASNSTINGLVESSSATFENINLTKDGTIDVINDAVIGKGSKLNGMTTAGDLYLEPGSELSKDGFARSENTLVVAGKIKGLAVAKSAVVENSGSIEKGGQIWAEHVHFNDFLPNDGEVMAEKITIGHRADPDFVMASNQSEVPPLFRDKITIKKPGWFVTLVDCPNLIGK